ncbi:zona pellucida protein C [Melanotaenia boesemani]|uniref:zona pellucida protein C n=1 Tax=Melanotaenia boesemani TaxID=1250792 RepID=UPI001C049D04|nr:zona pellucida protein C [Melanotaenia boesemani]
MGTIHQVLCIFLGRFIAAISLGYEDAMFPHDFESFLENDKLFPFERNIDFLPFDNIFSSWRTWAPDFSMLAEFPPTMNVPRVQVFCDESKLTLLVDKKSSGLTLTKEEMQLGNGCYSNKELPNQFAFVYDLDQCGTTLVLQNGLQAFTNSLHLNLKKTTPTWWQALTTVYIYCIPKRLNKNADFAPTPAVNALSFNIQAMDPSWTNAAESNIYKRGNMIHLQVSAQIGPYQQLFIHSCFVSASPEPHTRPRHAVVLNKGCSSSLGSPHTVAQFAASNRADVVNLMLNTSNLISELYIHCNLVVSDEGVTSVSKSCNYDVIQSRWEDLSGDVEVCGCCSSKCKGPSVKNLPEDFRGMVNIGPLEIVDNIETSPALPDLETQISNTRPNSVQSVTPEPVEDVTLFDSSVSSKLPASPQGVVLVRQDPDARLTLWLPGQVQAELGNDIISQSEDGSLNQVMQSDDTSYPETHLNYLQNEINGKAVKDYKSVSLDMNILPVAEWPPQYHAAFGEGFQRKSRLVRSGDSDAEGAQADPSLPTEISINLMLVKKPKPIILDSNIVTEESQKWMPVEMDLNDLKQSDFNPVKDEQPQMQMDTPVMEEQVAQPVIRSKLEFSKSVDGSQTLSYEEEVKRDGKGVLGRCERDATCGKRETRMKGLRSTFLYLLRRMNKAE